MSVQPKSPTVPGHRALTGKTVSRNRADTHTQKGTLFLGGAGLRTNVFASTNAPIRHDIEAAAQLHRAGKITYLNRGPSR